MRDILNLIWLISTIALQSHTWCGQSICKTIHGGFGSIGSFFLRGCCVGVVEWGVITGLGGSLLDWVFLERYDMISAGSVGHLPDSGPSSRRGGRSV